MMIFVAGAGGFIGSCIARHLASLGHEVVAHIRSRDGDLESGSVPENAEVVVNSAGRLGGRGSDPGQLRLANEDLPGMLADRCAETGASLVHLSTPGVTGLRPDATEDMDYSPWGEYESTKMRGELAVIRHPGLNEGSVTVLRPDFVYGPGDLHKLPLFKHVARGWMPLIGKRGGRIRPTYCGDVCRAVEASLPGGRLFGGLYNVGGPRVVTVGELAERIAAQLGTGVRLLPLPRLLFRIALHLGPLCPSSLTESRLRLFGEDHFVSTARAERAGFIPEWDLSAGLRQTLSWYVSEDLLK